VETAPTSIFSERPIATAIAVGIATLIPHLFLPPALSLALAAIVMGMVAGVYFGFAVMRGDNFQQQIEFNVAGRLTHSHGLPATPVPPGGKRRVPKCVQKLAMIAPTSP
jgi:hypothetical protein